MSSVEPQTPYNEYPNVDGVTTVFPYEFQLLSASDLVVTVNGVVVPSSDFILTGVGVQAGGDITFNTAPLVGSDVLLSRVLVLQRNTDYQYNGDLKENTVDNDFNRLWQALQGIDAVIGGAVRVPFPEQVDALPDATSRANTVLGFDGAGKPITTIPASGSAAAVLLQLANTVSALLGSGLVGHNNSLMYPAGTVGFNLNKRKAYFCTGTTADRANLQAMVNAASAWDVIDVFGDGNNLNLNLGAVVTKPQLLLRGVRCKVTWNDNTKNAFEFLAGTPAGYPGRIGITGFEFQGPYAGSGTACFVKIDANCPYNYIAENFGSGVHTGIWLRDTYGTLVEANTVDMPNAFGSQIFRECHVARYTRNFFNNATVASFAANYGGGAGTGVVHDLCFDNDAHQHAAVGTWLEQAQEVHGHIYYEGNTVNDQRIGVADGGAYLRACYNVRIQGFSSASACAGDLNVRIEHSVGVEILGAGFNSGTPTTTPHVYVDGFCDFVHISPLRVNSTNPYNFVDPSRVVVSRAGRSIFPSGMQGGIEFGSYTTKLGRIWHEVVGGRNGLNIESLSQDIRLRAPNNVRFEDSAGALTCYVDVLSKTLFIQAASFLTVNGILSLNNAIVNATGLPVGTPGVAGRLYVDASGFVKRA